MNVHVCLEIGPEAAGAFAPNNPGCWVFGRDQKSALRKVKAAVTEWYDWVAAHGEAVEAPRAILIEPAETLRVTYNPAEAGKPEPLFWSEIPPAITRDIKRTLRLMNHSRSDLLKLCSNLDRQVLSWKPEGEPRTISNCLKHIAIVEWWYITRLNIDLPKDFPENIFELLRYTRQLAERSLRSLSKQKRTSIFQPKDDPSPICNLWTARKVLRRFVDHERLHTNYIKKIMRLYHSGMQDRIIEKDSFRRIVS